jgi:dihydroorotate dehydrogenase
LSLIALQTLRPLLPPSIPIIGCGGITTGEDALAMAKAGASMVQLYTSFGYRGVGTPRLIKDEISASLSSQSSKSSWKSTIGSDYSDKSQMGWRETGDEDRLRKTSQQLMQEAQGLGELLKDLQQKEDTASLVRAAEEALGQFQPAKPRDNLMGSSESGTGQAAVEASSPDAVESEASAESGRTITSGMTGGVPAGLEEVLPTAAADLAPIVVEESPAPPTHPEADEWTQTVREGQKRLV